MPWPPFALNRLKCFIDLVEFGIRPNFDPGRIVLELGPLPCGTVCYRLIENFRHDLHPTQSLLCRLCHKANGAEMRVFPRGSLGKIMAFENVMGGCKAFGLGELSIEPVPG